MKKYRVFASQIVYHYKDIEAETIEQAEDIAFSNDEDFGDWKEFQYGDWQIEQSRELIDESTIHQQ
jgi:hypothetical protein